MFIQFYKKATTRILTSLPQKKLTQFSKLKIKIAANTIANILPKRMQ